METSNYGWLTNQQYCQSKFGQDIFGKRLFYCIFLSSKDAHDSCINKKVVWHFVGSRQIRCASHAD